MKCDVIAPCINYYQEVFDASEFIELIEKESQKDWPRLSWMRSSIGDEENQNTVSDYRSSMTLSLNPITTDENLVEELDLIRNVFFKIWKNIDDLVWDYRKNYQLFLSRNEGLSVLRYSDGSQYHLHADASPLNGRQMSMVAYLNDDYIGGELEFPFFNLKIKPSSGSLILFPSSYAYSHIAHPVTKNIKYSMVTWFQ